MAYRISYGAEVMYGTKGTIHIGRTMAISVLCCLLFLTAAYLYWPEAAVVIDKLLSYDGWADTKKALDVLALELQNGVSLPAAVTAFCQEVIGGSLSVGT